MATVVGSSAIERTPFAVFGVENRNWYPGAIKVWRTEGWPARSTSWQRSPNTSPRRIPVVAVNRWAAYSLPSATRSRKVRNSGAVHRLIGCLGHLRGSAMSAAFRGTRLQLTS
jgi:hypothetical protein